MCNKIITTLKKYIRLNLEDKIYQIMNNKDKARLLSERDLMKLIQHMEKIKKYSHCLMIYIYIKSEHRYDLELFKLDSDFLVNKCVLGELDLVKFALSDEVRKIYPIIENDIKHNKRDNLRAIRIASVYGHIEIVKFLLSYEIKERYPCIDFYEWASISMRAACGSGHVEIVKFLLSNEMRSLHPSIISAVDLSNDKNNQDLISSCGCGHLEVVKFLLSPEVVELYPSIDPSKNDNICIRVASRYGKEKIVRFLLSDEILERFPSIDPTAGNNEVISKFAASCNLDAVKFLLEFEDGRIIKQGLDGAMESAKNALIPSLGKEILDLLIYYFNYSQIKK